MQWDNGIPMATALVLRTASFVALALVLCAVFVACAHRDAEPTTTGAAQDLSSTDPNATVRDDDDAGGHDIVRPFPSLSACLDTMALMPRACDCSCSAGADVILTCHCP